MGIFDKAKDMLGDERKTDALLDQAEKIAKDKLGEDKAAQVSKVRDAVDKRIGDDNPTENPSEGNQPGQRPEGHRPENNQR